MIIPFHRQETEDQDSSGTGPLSQQSRGAAPAREAVVPSMLLCFLHKYLLGE